MPPLLLTRLLQSALPDLSATGRAVVSALGCRNGDAPPAAEVAAWVGLRNRHQLARLLRRDGLPPLTELAGWARVLYWTLEAEATGASLLQLAHRDGMDPAAAYRLVRRVTGQRWTEVRRAGVSRTMSRFPARRAGDPAYAPRPAARSGNTGLPLVPPRFAEGPRRALTPRHPDGILAGRVRVAGSPFDVALSRNGIGYVTCIHAAAVECVQSQPPHPIHRIPTGPVPTRFLFGPSEERALVTLQFADEVAVIDLAGRRRTGGIPVPGNPLAATVSPNGRILYVTTNRDLLCRIELARGRLIASVAIPQAGYDLALHPDAPRLYVPTWKAGQLLEVDAESLQTLRTFDLGGIVQDVVVAQDGLTLYAANQRGWLDVIHLGTGRLAGRLDLGAPAISLALSPDDAVLYAGLVFSGRVLAIDQRALAITRVIHTGGKPRRIAFDRVGRTAVVANEAGWVDFVI